MTIDLDRWSAAVAVRAFDLCDRLGVDREAYAASPGVLGLPLQRTIKARLDAGDEGGLHDDLVAYLADHLIRGHACQWISAHDPAGKELILLAHDEAAIDVGALVTSEMATAPVLVQRLEAMAEELLDLVEKNDCC